MSDHVDRSLLLALARPLGIEEQEDLPEGDGAEVLHGTGGEIGNGEQVELVARIGNAEILLEMGEREHGRIHGEVDQMSLAGHVDDANGRGADVHRLARLERADHEGQEVGRQEHRRCEPDFPSSILEQLRCDLGATRDGEEIGIDHEGDLEHGLQVGLVPAREGSTSAGRLELGGGERAGGSVGVGERAAVEPAQLVVEEAVEVGDQHVLSRLDGRGELEGGALVVVVEADRAGDRVVGRLEVGVGHHELGGIADELVGGSVHRDGGSARTAKCRRLQVGFEAQLVVRGDRGTRQPIRILDHAGMVSARAGSASLHAVGTEGTPS